MSNIVFAQVDSAGDVQVRTLRGQLHDLVERQAVERGDYQQRDHALSWEIAVLRTQIKNLTGVDPLATWL
jgi:hypothetical protein